MNRNRKAKPNLICLLMVALVLMFSGRRIEADFTFGVAENLGPTINTPMHEIEPGLSRDSLSLYFSRCQPDGSGVVEAWVAQRPTKYDPWDDPVSIGPWVDTAAGVTAIVNRIVKEVVMDDLLFIFDIFLGAITHDHVINALPCAAGYFWILLDYMKVILKCPLPVKFVVITCTEFFCDIVI